VYASAGSVPVLACKPASSALARDGLKAVVAAAAATMGSAVAAEVTVDLDTSKLDLGCTLFCAVLVAEARITIRMRNLNIFSLH
jgi:hypothetical protein